MKFLPLRRPKHIRKIFCQKLVPQVDTNSHSKCLCIHSALSNSLHQEYNNSDLIKENKDEVLDCKDNFFSPSSVELNNNPDPRRRSTIPNIKHKEYHTVPSKACDSPAEAVCHHVFQYSYYTNNQDGA